MKKVPVSWLHQGFFAIGNEGSSLMQLVRDELEQRLHLQFRIESYPIGPQWCHTYWWRQGELNYAEAQFFAQISQDFPVLSLGVSIEKGYEEDSVRQEPEKFMDRLVWDWPRLTEHISTICSTDVVEAAAKLPEPKPINIRTRSQRYETKGLECWKTRIFSYVDDQWFERYKGRVQPEIISSYIHELDRQRDSWVNVYFACDFGPKEVDDLSDFEVATILIAFDSIRRRLRPQH